MTKEEIIKKLKLQLHPSEGGYFVETYRSEELVSCSNLPERYSQNKSFSTAIYYMLTPETFSALHRLPSDEVFHFYLGDPVVLFIIYPDGKGEEIILGQDITGGEFVQYVVPKEVWFGARLKNGGKWALMGTTVAPGFDFSDFEDGNREELVAKYPQYKKWIHQLTR